MTAKDCLIGRRSIRQFTEKTVSREVLESIVETASNAPSWKNTQITRYIALEGDQKNEVAMNTMAWNQKIIEGAPMLIAVSMVTGICGFERDGSFSTKRGDGWQMFDVGAACEAFCLAAFDQGLGTVIMGIFDQDAVSDLLKLPVGQELAALIAIGYPAQSPMPPKRKEVSELLSYGFGTGSE